MDKRQQYEELREIRELCTDKYTDLIMKIWEERMELDEFQKMFATRTLLIKYLEEAQVLKKLEPPQAD